MTFVDTHPLRGAFVANTINRLVNLIGEQGEDLLRDGGVEFSSRAASTVLLLGEQGEMSAADIAKSLDQPHQLVTQRIDLLLGQGIVTRIDDRSDARRKVLSLTAKGKKQLQRLKRRLALADAAFAELFAEIGCDLSQASLRALEALGRSSILNRVRSLKPVAA